MTTPAMTDLPRVRVDTPPAAPPSRYGLFSTATLVDGVDGFELAGIEYPAVCSNRVDPAVIPCGFPPPPDNVTGEKQAQPTRDMVAASPFVLYAMDDCALGVDAVEQQTALRQRFVRGERHAVEDLVESGALNNYPSLVGTATNPPDVLATPGDDLALIDAVGRLEQWLAATTGGVGIIHIPRWLAARVSSTQVALGGNGPARTTMLDNALAFGSGYLGRAPAGATDDGTVWLYATPPVTIRRSEIVEPVTRATGGFDVRSNTGPLLVERIYVVDWPCRAAAVPTNIPRFALPAPLDVARPSTNIEGSA